MRLLLSANLGWIGGITTVFALTVLHAAEPDPTGRAIYQELCAHCHGANGEGVDEEYDEALLGDWPIDRLARRIHRSMPEDDPDQCVDEDAEAVAQYIHGAFYSPEARAHQDRPRVELARLTNRQYENTAADLIGHFRGKSRRPGGEHGLNATYYNHRGFRRESELEKRVDAVVERQSKGGGLHPEQVGTNGFSIRWQGSIYADETGDYQFVIKTPNGARLWVNNDQRALIDAGVASGSMDEHKSTVRLLGGRYYPIRLEWFQFKEKQAAIVLRWKPPYGSQQVIPSRNLVPDRSNPTLVITTPFPPDDSSVGYERGVSVSREWDESTTFAAIEVANEVVDHLDRLSRSKLQDDDRVAKLKQFCREFVAHAFRRPLTGEQERAYVEAQFEQAANAEEAVKRVVLLTLKSPRFLYLGLEDGSPDDYTVAARLSFSLWDSLPDRELWKAAAQGRMHSREAVAGHVGRMVSDLRARSKMLDSLHHWLQVTHVESLAKDPDLYPQFTPEVAADLRTSLNLFLADVIQGGRSDYRALLLSDEVYVNRRLAEFYGVEPPSAGGFVKVALNLERGSGVLTHPYLLAAFSYPKLTSPIHRGVFLTRNIVGRGLKPPPVDVAFKDSEFDPGLTMRQKVEELTRPSACQGCHSVINPLGFSLESYDAVGRLRTRDNGRPVDTVSEYLTDTGETVHLTGARDVAQFAVGSPLAHEAFIEQMFHQVVKQPIRAYGPEVMTELRRSFVASDFDIRTLLEEIAILSALHSVPPQTASR